MSKFSRRGFLRGSVACAAILSLPRAAWAAQNLSSFNVLPSNSAAVNGLNLLSAIVQARSGGFSLRAEEGLYEIDAGVIEMGYQKFALIADGPRVIFRQRTSGIGRFLSFNGAVTEPMNDAICQIVFGGPFQIAVRGNPNGATSDAVYINKMVDCRFSFRPRDAAVLCRIDDAGNNPPYSGVGVVLNEFDITTSSNWDNEPVLVPSTYGLLAKNCYASRFRLNLENCGGSPGGQYAAYFNESARNILIGGSLESNAKGGIYLTTTCKSFVVDSMNMEANGAAPDLVCHGYNNVFRNIVTGTAGQRATIDGNYNRFENCDLNGVIVSNANLGGNKNKFTECRAMTANGGFTDTGNGTVVRSCDGVANKN